MEERTVGDDTVNESKHGGRIVANESTKREKRHRRLIIQSFLLHVHTQPPHFDEDIYIYISSTKTIIKMRFTLCFAYLPSQIICLVSIKMRGR